MGCINYVQRNKKEIQIIGFSGIWEFECAPKMLQDPEVVRHSSA